MGTTGTRDDQARLRHFIAVVEACVSRRAIQESTIRANLKITMTAGAPLQVDADHGDSEDVRSLMLDFRKFIASDDDANFNKVCNVIERRVVDAETLQATRYNRSGWKALMKGTGSFSGSGQTYAGAGLLDVWFNGVLFHNDPDKERFYRSLDPTVTALFHQEVNSTVMEGLRIVHAQRNVVNDVLARGLLDGN